MVFPVVMYGCESWTIKKTEHRRIDAFELWCWRLVRVPWTARRSNQSILEEISPGCSLEGRMLKPKLWYIGYFMWRANSLEKTLMLREIRAGREGGNRGWDSWMASLTQWTWIWTNSSEIVKDREAWHAAIHGIAKSQTTLSDWTTTTTLISWNWISSAFAPIGFRPLTFPESPITAVSILRPSPSLLNTPQM